MLCTVDGIEWEIILASRDFPLGLNSRTPDGFRRGSLTSTGPRPDSNFPTERVESREGAHTRAVSSLTELPETSGGRRKPRISRVYLQNIRMI